MWNQTSRAALSLTFDDGLPCQREHALPLLQKYKLPATFFLIEESPYEKGRFNRDVWRKAAQDGHEIGGHSVTHRAIELMSPDACHQEASRCKAFLENRLRTRVETYAYPHTDGPSYYQIALQQTGYIAARSGRKARTDKFVTKKDDTNLFLTPAFHVNEATISHDQVVFAMVDAALEREAWLTLMFHSVGTCSNGCVFDNVSKGSFELLLQFLVDRRERGLWVAPYGTVVKELKR